MADALNAEERTPTLSIAIDVLVEISVRFIREEGAFGAVRWGPLVPARAVEAAYKETNRLIAERLYQRFSVHNRPSQHDCQIAVETVGHLVGMAFEYGRAGHQPTLDAAAEIAQWYLSQKLSA